MARRESIPPADVLFSGGKTRTLADPERKHIKVTVYMPVELVAELDVERARLRRQGDNVDRGRLVRSAIRLAQARSGEWLDAIREEEH